MKNRIATFLLALCLPVVAHAYTQDLYTDEIKTGQEVGVLNDNFKRLYASKLDIKPGDILPKRDSTYDLGAAGTEWARIYVDILTVTNSVLPKTDSTGSIGASGTEWANGYFDTITVTTITASAKAQGFWKNSGTQVFSGATSVSYTDLDLSATIGANHAVVLLKVVGSGAALDNIVCRQNGDTTDYFSTSGFASVNRGHVTASVGSYIICPTDGSGILEWRVQTTNNAVITLIGYVR